MYGRPQNIRTGKFVGIAKKLWLLTSADQNPEDVTRQENWEKGRDHETQDWPKGCIMNCL